MIVKMKAGVFMSKDLLKYDENEELEYTVLYQGLRVRIITRFRTRNNTVVLIEDENGEIYEVFKEHLSEI
jgi:hypothetical protein